MEKRKRRKWPWVLLAILMFPCILYGGVALVNNGIAARLERQLRACPLPPETELLDSTHIAGRLMANGNGMEWRGLLLLKSSLDEQALRDWYGEHFDDCAWVDRQETPTIYEYYDYRFEHFDPNAACWRVELSDGSTVGCEDSFWEALLNTDLRGH